MFTLHHGDALEQLQRIPSGSVDSVVTDPPAAISFLGNDWDDDKGGRDQWIAWLASILAEAFRALKPGGYALVWSLPRTEHWTGMAVENAGFEVKDKIHSVIGQGFPKATDMSKAFIALGLEAEAQKWQGFKTALKPAAEAWILAKKPISEKNIAQNLLKHGVGAMNIDGCRGGQDGRKSAETIDASKGRYPTNFLLTHSHDCEFTHAVWNCTEGCPVLALDSMSGTTRSAVRKVKPEESADRIWDDAGGWKERVEGGFTDNGGASRFFPVFDWSGSFFYTAKPASAERNAGCDALPRVEVKGDVSLRQRGVHGETGKPNKAIFNANFHPTVKPVKLMSYLVRLVTPRGGTVLDPFMGSGTTGVACMREGLNFIGIERDETYLTISRARIEHAQSQAEPSLFGDAHE